MVTKTIMQAIDGEKLVEIDERLEVLNKIAARCKRIMSRIDAEREKACNGEANSL